MLDAGEQFGLPVTLGEAEEFLRANTIELTDDNLSGGAGDDVLVGDGGRDLFCFSVDDGYNTITDLKYGEDGLVFLYVDHTEEIDVGIVGNDTIVRVSETQITLEKVHLTREQVMRSITFDLHNNSGVKE